MLAAENRLRSSRDFRRIYRVGRSWGHPLVVMQVRSVPEGKQWGISASKKVGKAVQRNRLRRQVREILREALPEWRQGHQGVIVVRPAAAEIGFGELRATLRELARRARLFREPGDPEEAIYIVPASRPRAAQRTDNPDQRSERSGPTGGGTSGASGAVQKA